MALGLVIHGETVVKVTGAGVFTDTEIGYSVEPIEVQPHLFWYNVPTDDYGRQVPVEKLAMLGVTKIRMTLVYYDQNHVQTLLARAQAGLYTTGQVQMGGAGKPLGGGGLIGTASNNLVTLTLVSVDGQDAPYIFEACHLYEQPVVIPLGVERSLMQLTFESFPYFNGAYGGVGSTELISANTKLWQREASS